MYRTIHPERDVESGTLQSFSVSFFRPLAQNTISNITLMMEDLITVPWNVTEPIITEHPGIK